MESFCAVKSGWRAPRPVLRIRILLMSRMEWDFFFGAGPPVLTESGPNIPAKILGGIGVSLGLGLVKLVAHAFYLRFLQEWA